MSSPYFMVNRKRQTRELMYNVAGYGMSMFDDVVDVKIPGTEANAIKISKP